MSKVIKTVKPIVKKVKTAHQIDEDVQYICACGEVAIRKERKATPGDYFFVCPKDVWKGEGYAGGCRMFFDPKKENKKVCSDHRKFKCSTCNPNFGVKNDRKLKCYCGVLANAFVSKKGEAWLSCGSKLLPTKAVDSEVVAWTNPHPIFHDDDFNTLDRCLYLLRNNDDIDNYQACVDCNILKVKGGKKCWGCTHKIGDKVPSDE